MTAWREAAFSDRMQADRRSTLYQRAAARGKQRRKSAVILSFDHPERAVRITSRCILGGPHDDESTRVPVSVHRVRCLERD